MANIRIVSTAAVTGLSIRHWYPLVSGASVHAYIANARNSVCFGNKRRQITIWRYRRTKAIRNGIDNTTNSARSGRLAINISGFLLIRVWKAAEKSRYSPSRSSLPAFDKIVICLGETSLFVASSESLDVIVRFSIEYRSADLTRGLRAARVHLCMHSEKTWCKLCRDTCVCQSSVSGQFCRII